MTNWLNARLNLLSEILVIARTIYQNKINAFLLVLLILAGSTYSLIMCNSSIQGTKINSVNNKVETLIFLTTERSSSRGRPWCASGSRM